MKGVETRECREAVQREPVKKVVLSMWPDGHAAGGGEMLMEDVETNHLETHLTHPV